MKSKRTILFAIALITLASLAGFTYDQENTSGSTVIVKATATTAKNYSFIRIYRDNSEVEKIALERLTGGVEAEESNFKTIVTTLNKLNQEGYQVVSSTELGTAGGNVSTYVLRK